MSSRFSTIYLATDHAGFSHKNSVKEWLVREGCTVIDYGAMQFDTDDDYPDYIEKAAAAVSVAPQHKAIIFGGSGQGEAIVANRFRNVRATVFYGGSDEIVTLSREHNDANVLSIGARFVSLDETKRIIWLWLHTEPQLEDRHIRRIKKIESLSQCIKPELHDTASD